MKEPGRMSRLFSFVIKGLIWWCLSWKTSFWRKVYVKGEVAALYVKKFSQSWWNRVGDGYYKRTKDGKHGEVVVWKEIPADKEARREIMTPEWVNLLRQGFCFRDLRKGVLKTLFSKKDFTTDMFQFVADKGVERLFAFFFGCENFWEWGCTLSLVWHWLWKPLKMKLNESLIIFVNGKTWGEKLS